MNKFYFPDVFSAKKVCYLKKNSLLCGGICYNINFRKLCLLNF